ncbi:MAG: M28 family peptidase, partial [Candidatus Thorarchaeota archaeon]
SEKLYRHILMTEGEKHPIYNPEQMEECADYILNEFESYGLSTSVHEFEVKGFDYTFRNIEATIGTSGPELLIVSHYDTVRNVPGANDNGSAITVMLETARVLSELPPDGAVRFVSFNLEELNPARTKTIQELSLKHRITDEEGRYTSWRTAQVIDKYWKLFFKYRPGSSSFADVSKRAISEIGDDLQTFELNYLKAMQSLNEGVTQLNYPGATGMMGSSAWVRDAPSSGISIRGVLCLETMGYTSSKANSQHLPTTLDSGIFKKFKTDSNLTIGDFMIIIGDCNSGPLADNLCTQCEHDSIDLPYACLQQDFTFEQAAYSMPDILRSDHSPFWREGIPALLISDTANFRYPYYHTPADTIDKLDFDFLTKICKAVIAMALKF